MSQMVFVLGLGVTLVGGGLAGTDLLLFGPQGVTRRNAERIQAGMTPADVAALLGRPGRYTGQYGRDSFSLEWRGRGVRVTVDFAAGVVGHFGVSIQKTRFPRLR